MIDLTGKLAGIVDGYYGTSDDYKYLKEILEEIEFLYSRGMLREKGLGRLISILRYEGPR